MKSCFFPLKSLHCQPFLQYQLLLPLHCQPFLQYQLLPLVLEQTLALAVVSLSLAAALLPVHLKMDLATVISSAMQKMIAVLT